MLVRGFVVAVWSVSLTAVNASIALSQNYPSKVVRILTNEAGGNVDFTSRLIAQGLSPNLGQQVIVENRGGGIIAAETAAKAAPDGYTLLFSSSTFWTQPLLTKTPYDPVADFSPVTLAVVSPNLLTVHPSLPVKSVKELIALAKARPGQLNYGSGGTGAPNHLAAELFNIMAGVKIVRIAYRSGGAAVNSLLAGEIQISFPSVAAATPYLNSGRLRALAVTTIQPSALAPGLPTVASSGLAGFEADVTAGVFAPSKTPETIVKRLNQEIVRVLNAPDAKERLLRAGGEVVTNSPEEFATRIKSEMSRLRKLIADTNIKAD